MNHGCGATIVKYTLISVGKMWHKRFVIKINYFDLALEVIFNFKLWY